jgi:hypothetical protein
MEQVQAEADRADKAEKALALKTAVGFRELDLYTGLILPSSIITIGTVEHCYEALERRVDYQCE